MELEAIKSRWQSSTKPKYNQQELNSIYSIKSGYELKAVSSVLSSDLVVAEIFAIVFILILQVLDLKTSDFWSGVLGLLALQHLILHQIQLILIRKRMKYAENIAGSIAGSIKGLSILLIHYRIWPIVLTEVLYFIYMLSFGTALPFEVILLNGILIGVIVGLVSNWLSAKLLRKHIKNLKRLSADLIES